MVTYCLGLCSFLPFSLLFLRGFSVKLLLGLPGKGIWLLVPRLFPSGNKIKSQEATDVSGTYFHSVKMNVKSEPSDVFRFSDPDVFRFSDPEITKYTVNY